MSCNYILIDFENLQPANLEKLADLPVKVYVFLGENPAKMSPKFVVAMQRLGHRGHYIEMSGNGPNALDFHIAYYVGEISATEPDAYFHIISKDSGFDPLIKHLRSRKPSPLRIYRCEQITDLAFLRPNAGVLAERLNQLTENLITRRKQLPRKLSGLESLVRDLFKNQPLDSQVGDLIAALKRKGMLSIANGIVEYHLPDAGPVIALPKNPVAG